MANHPSPSTKAASQPGDCQARIGWRNPGCDRLALVAKVISVFWVLAPLLAIVVLAIFHERVLNARARCSRTVAYYQRALARIDNILDGSGEAGERFQSESHPYSRDLDIFGEGSLFELLCTARTRVGQETLAKWLLAPASPDQVRARQAAVVDLRSRLDLREDLAVLAEEAGSLAPAEGLAAWGEGEPLLASTLLANCVRATRGLMAGESGRLDGLGGGVSGPARQRGQRGREPRFSPARGSSCQRRRKCCSRSWAAVRRAGSTGSGAIQRRPGSLNCGPRSSRRGCLHRTGLHG